MPPAYRDLRYAGGLLPVDIQLLLGRFEPERRGASVRVETDSDGTWLGGCSVGVSLDADGRSSALWLESAKQELNIHW